MSTAVKWTVGDEKILEAGFEGNSTFKGFDSNVKGHVSKGNQITPEAFVSVWKRNPFVQILTGVDPVAGTHVLDAAAAAAPAAATAAAASASAATAAAASASAAAA